MLRDGVPQAAVADVTHTERDVRITFDDGSTIIIPRMWRGRITDIAFAGNLAGADAVVDRLAGGDRGRAHGRTPFRTAPSAPSSKTCAVNQVFYRREPHLMRRYSALAFDNIRRAPLAFVTASAYRAVRLFVISGTGDRQTAQQFAASGARLRGRERSRRPST